MYRTKKEVTERFIEDALMLSLSTKEGRLKAKQRGLDFVDENGEFHRQPNLSPYGIPDMCQLSFDEQPPYHPDDNPHRYHVLHLIELKSERLKIEHVVQISRYISGFKSFMRTDDGDKFHMDLVSGILLTLRPQKTEDRDDSVFVLQLDAIQNDSQDLIWYEYEFSVDGFKFYNMARYSDFIKGNGIINGKFLQKIENFKNKNPK